MPMSDYFASAFIRVKADPKTFRTDLENLKKSVAKKPFLLPVKADARGFKTQLQEQVNKTFVSITVRPDSKGFRAALIKQLAGLKVPVEVIPTAPAKVSAAARAAAIGADPVASGAVTGSANLAKAELGLVGVEKQLIETQLLLNAAVDESLTDAQRKARLQEALTWANTPISDADWTQIQHARSAP